MKQIGASGTLCCEFSYVAGFEYTSLKPPPQPGQAGTKDENIIGINV